MKDWLRRVYGRNTDLRDMPAENWSPIAAEVLATVARFFAVAWAGGRGG